MKLNINKFGKIYNADISWNGLTVIAGKNDSGKSTVGKLFYVITKSLAQFRNIHTEYFGKEYYNRLLFLLTFIQRGELREKLQDNIDFFAKLEDIYSKLKNKNRNDNPNNLANIYKLDNVFFEEIISILDNIHNMDLDDFLKEEIKNLKNNLQEKSNNNICFTKSFNLILRDCFLKNYNNSLHSEDKATVRFEVENSTNIEFSSLKNKIDINYDKLDISDKNLFYKDITYIDFPGIIDERFQHLNQDKYDWTDDVLIKSYEIKKKSIQLDKTYENYSLNEIFGESFFYVDKDDSEFKYKTSQNASALNIINIASGAKSLGLIHMFLKYGIIDKETPIILDEPENHLHPEWQIIYAKFIVELTKQGFKILLTSHSPTFIHALIKGCLDSNIWDTNIVNFYLSEANSQIENYSDIRNVNDCVNDIFKSLSEPVEKLMIE